MFWQDDTEQRTSTSSSDVVDVVFHLQGNELPCDHAWALMSALRVLLPWFGDDPRHGLHLIHPAASGNGWYSPEDTAGATMYLPRRARLALRLPQSRVEEAGVLQGQMLHIDGYPLQVGRSELRPLSPHTTLHARHVVSGASDPTELEFLEWAARTLAAQGIRCRKMVAGRESRIATPQGTRLTRSLMAADLKRDVAFRLQELGLGDDRCLGCGVFVPHKAVRDLFGEE